MNLIFAERARAPPAKHFALPSQLDLGPPQTKKRRRDDGHGDEKKEFEVDACLLQFSGAPQAPVLASIRRHIEYGRGCVSGERVPQDEAGKNDSARQMSSLHLALSILCHVAAIDESGHFIRSSPNSSRKPLDTVAGRSDLKNNQKVDKNCVVKGDSVCFFSLSDIYTTVRALKLEYEDVSRQQKGGTDKTRADAQSTAASLLATEARVSACLALLEPTILRLILNFDRARKIPMSYVSNVLRALPQVFAMVNWPLTVLQKEYGKTPERKHLSECGDAYDDISNAATAIVLKVMQTLKRGDCLRILSSQSSAENARPSDTPLLMSLEEIMTRALNGVYQWRGLYGAVHDMRLLLYGLYATVPPEQERTVAAAHQQFEQLLQLHYSNFLRKTGLYNFVEKPLLRDETIFDVYPLPRDDDAASYTDTQQKCLQLLDLLRKVDSKGWFENPVYDMANVELSSVERWVRGPSFGAKTNRDAFLALRDVLEQMVNNCVLSYGPTSQYSHVITLVRQRLVDAAREVQLI